MMATSQSDTAWFKKGDKLPDGTIAKKSLVWNTKTGKRQTGAVSIIKTAGGVKAGQTVKYKAGAKKRTVESPRGGSASGSRPVQKPKPASRPASTSSRPAARPTGGGGAGGNGGGGASNLGAAKNFAPGTKRKGPNGNWVVAKGGKWVPVAKPNKPTATNTVNSGYTNGQASKPVQKPASSSQTPSHYTGASLNKPGGGSPPKGKPGQVYVNGRWVAGNSSAAQAAANKPPKVTTWGNANKRK